MAYALVQGGSTPYEVLKLIASNTAVAQSVMEFFSPRCDCDVVEWLKERILDSDPEVIAAVRSLIAKQEVLAPPAPSTSLNSASGDSFVLVRSWCTAGSRFGEFVDHTGTSVEALIQSADPGCV